MYTKLIFSSSLHFLNTQKKKKLFENKNNYLEPRIVHQAAVVVIVMVFVVVGAAVL